MTVSLILLSVLLLGTFFAYKAISQKCTLELHALEKKKVQLTQKYEFMIEQRKQLKNELKDKERQLATLRNNESGIKTISSKDLDIIEVDENEKVSRYLIQEGRITLEQNEKVLQKMGTMQMDYLGVCLTLGYIDIETAKKTIKINKITTKSDGLM